MRTGRHVAPFRGQPITTVPPPPARADRPAGSHYRSPDTRRRVPPSAQQLACGATPLAERLLAATRALVHRVRHEQSLALESLADDDRIDGGQRLATQPISDLFTGRFAINGASARWPATTPGRLVRPPDDPSRSNTNRHVWRSSSRVGSRRLLRIIGQIDADPERWRQGLACFPHVIGPAVVSKGQRRARERLAGRVRDVLVFTPDVELLPPGTLPRSERKTKRLYRSYRGEQP